VDNGGWGLGDKRFESLTRATEALAPVRQQCFEIERIFDPAESCDQNLSM